MKRPQQLILPIKSANRKWARNDKKKVAVFSDYFAGIFNTFTLDGPQNLEIEIHKYLKIRPSLHKNYNQRSKSYNDEKHNLKKALQFVTAGKVLQETTYKCIKSITQLFNALLKARYFPQCNITQLGEFYVVSSV